MFTFYLLIETHVSEIGKNCPKTAVSEAVRENIDLIENDLKVKESSLLDEMQGYLSEEDVIKITRSSRKDQAHFFCGNY